MLKQRKWNVIGQHVFNIFYVSLTVFLKVCVNAVTTNRGLSVLLSQAHYTCEIYDIKYYNER